MSRRPPVKGGLLHSRRVFRRREAGHSEGRPGTPATAVPDVFAVLEVRDSRDPTVEPAPNYHESARPREASIKRVASTTLTEGRPAQSGITAILSSARRRGDSLRDRCHGLRSDGDRLELYGGDFGDGDDPPSQASQKAGGDAVRLRRPSRTARRLRPG